MAPKLAFGFKKSKKPKVSVQIEEEAEEEEETPNPKKQKTEDSADPAVQATQEPTPLPGAPEDPEVLKVANKLAEYVAKNGRSFEDVAKNRNTEHDSPFRFLLDKSCSEYAYYEWKVAECEKLLAEERAASVHAEYREVPLAPEGNSASQHGGAKFQSSNLTSSVPPWQSATQPPPPPWHCEDTSNDHSLRQWQPSQDGERNRQAQLHGCAESEPSGCENRFGAQPREESYASREQEQYRGYGQRGDIQHEGYLRHDEHRGQSNYDNYFGEHYRSLGTDSRDGGLEAKSAERYGRDNYQEDYEKTLYDARDRDHRDQHYAYKGYGGNQVYRERNSGYGGRERSFTENGGRERSFPEKPERRPPASSTPREKSPGRLAAEAAAADGDSMALMNYFTKKAAQQEDARAAKKDPKEMPPLRDELPEKDKNKHVRPAKAPDGKSRTHHMGHYIPEEELTKFMAKCGSEADKAKAADIDASKRIDSSNKGYALLAKMGWTEGQGLGASAGGMIDPVSGGEVKENHLGIGAGEASEVSESDDIFNQYKKRMMLGYKYRPNPLGNPRKSYY